MDLNNQTPQNNTPLLSSKAQTQRKRVLEDETPQSCRTRSRVSTEFLIQFDQKQSQLNMMRNNYIEENKKRFSEMMDLPYVVKNADFTRRGKTFQVFKKLDLIRDEYQTDKIQNVVLKRTTPLQEIETNQKIGNVFFRKKKARQTGTLYSCELWSRPYYDHIINKTQLKLMHLKMQESSKCKNYDQRINDLHNLFLKWQKKQQNLVNTSDFIVPFNDQMQRDQENDNESYKDQNDLNNQNDQNDQIEESFYSSKKSKFFRPIYTEPDQESEDSFIGNIADKKSDQKQYYPFTNRATKSIHQNESSKQYYVSSQVAQPFAKKNVFKLNSLSNQTQNNSIFSNPQSVTDHKKTVLSNSSFTKGFLTERFDKKKHSIEQNTTISTNIGEHSSFIQDNIGNRSQDKSLNKTSYKFDDKSQNKTQNKLNDKNEIKIQNKLEQKSINTLSNEFQSKYKTKIKQIFKNECNFLIKDCAQYQQDSIKIKKQINCYMNKKEQEQQDEINKKNFLKQKEEFSQFLIKQLK